MTGRFPNVTHAVRTSFGTMYVHLEFDPATGRPTGGSISDPQKEPKAQVAQLVQALSKGLDEAMKEIGGKDAEGG